jgi:hypothetical protein
MSQPGIPEKRIAVAERTGVPFFKRVDDGVGGGEMGCTRGMAEGSQGEEGVAREEEWGIQAEERMSVEGYVVFSKFGVRKRSRADGRVDLQLGFAEDLY